MRPMFFPAVLLLAVLVACAPSPQASDGPADSGPPAQPSDTASTSPTEEEAGDVAEQALLPNAVSPEDGLLLGGQPSAEQLDRLAAAGYRTVVNLRGADEEGLLSDEAYRERGIEVVHLPVTGAEDLDEENARRLGELIDDPGKRPLAAHCGSGNRVGALIALAAYHSEGISPEEALEIGLDSGLTRLEPVVRERLGLPAAAEEEEGTDEGSASSS